MFDSDAPWSMWELAAEKAIHVYNRTLHKSTDFKTPLKKFAPETDSELEFVYSHGEKKKRWQY